MFDWMDLLVFASIAGVLGGICGFLFIPAYIAVFIWVVKKLFE